jgi:hypothetical protein
VKRASIVAIIVWVALLYGILSAPASSDTGDHLTRYTIRLALAYYAAATGLMLFLTPAEWAAASGQGGLTRWCWTLAWAAYVVHVGMAFHFYHGWSHDEAVRHTEEVSGFGPGVYVSHLFTLLWTADVAWWWLRPNAYAGRPAWIGRVLHAFMAFIVFNGTVVYETGTIRWAGAVMFLVLGALWFRSRPERLAPERT